MHLWVHNCKYSLCNVNLTDLLKGWTAGKCHRLVPQPSGLRLLAVRNRRQHTDAEPELPRAVRGHCDRSRAHDFCREGLSRGFPNIPKGKFLRIEERSQVSEPKSICGNKMLHIFATLHTAPAPCIYNLLTLAPGLRSGTSTTRACQTHVLIEDAKSYAK